MEELEQRLRVGSLKVGDTLAQKTLLLLVAQLGEQGVVPGVEVKEEVVLCVCACVCACVSM